MEQQEPNRKVGVSTSSGHVSLFCKTCRKNVPDISHWSKVHKVWQKARRARKKGSPRPSPKKRVRKNARYKKPSRREKRAMRALGEKYIPPMGGAMRRKHYRPIQPVRKNPSLHRKGWSTGNEKEVERNISVAKSKLKNGWKYHDVTQYLELMGWSSPDANLIATLASKGMRANPKRKTKRVKKARKRKTGFVIVRIGRKRYKCTRAELAQLIKNGYRPLRRNPRFVGGKGKMTAIEYKATDGAVYRHDFRKAKPFHVEKGALVASPISHSKEQGLLG